MTYEQVLGHFNGVKPVPGGHRARCPGRQHKNGDRHPSLDIRPGDTHVAVFQCRSIGCGLEEILEPAGLTVKDVMNSNGNGARARAPRAEEWTWRTKGGRTRKQYRIGDEKPWQVKGLDEADVRGPLHPKHLMFTAHARRGAPTHYLTEGASDAVALGKAGLSAIGRPPCVGSKTSISRLNKQARLVVIPDYDVSGYRQATAWGRALREAGYEVAFVDLVALNGGPEPVEGWDVRDWLAGKPANVEGALTEASVAELKPVGYVPDEATNQAELARVFIAHDPRGKDFAWRPRVGWQRWTSSGWLDDDEGVGFYRRIQECGEHRYGKRDDKGVFKPLPTMGAALNTARGAERVAKDVLRRLHWDAEPEMLGLADGYAVNLRTGVERKQTRDDYITRRCNARPADDWRGTRWAEFLAESLTGSVADWLQIAFGYAATGHTKEHLLMFFHGRGGSGKGTLTLAIDHALGDYAQPVDADDFMVGATDKHPAWLADLHAKRLVIADDLEENCTFSAGRVKRLVAGTPHRARFMGQNYFRFIPQAQLIFVGNFEPRLQAADSGMARRLAVVGMNNQPEQPDKGLLDTLKREAPHVLRWLLDGARRYLRDGLPDPPASVVEASRKFHENANEVTAFVAEAWPDHERRESKTAYADYKTWCAENGARPLGKLRFLAQLRAGFQCRTDFPSNSKTWVVFPDDPS